MKIDRSGDGVPAANEEVVDFLPTKLDDLDRKQPVEFLNSGDITLNLALSGRGRDGGWPRGRISNAVGDGSTGKTLAALELAAHCFYRMMGNKSKNFPPVKKVKVIINNGERVMDFPIADMYGKAFDEGVDWRRTPTVEEMGRDITRELIAIKPGEFVLYIVDSLDSIPSAAGRERFLKAAKTDKEEDASYNAEKAAYLSQKFFGNICDLMAGKDFTLFIVSQIRVNFGITFGKKYHRDGGKALDFYTHAVAWMYKAGELKRTFHGQERVFGIKTLIQIERSKVTKPFRYTEMQILFDYGIDSISTSLAFLYGPKVESLVWDLKLKAEREKALKALRDPGEIEEMKAFIKELFFDRAGLIRFIERHNLQDELARRVEEEWDIIEREVAPTDRLKRY